MTINERFQSAQENIADHLPQSDKLAMLKLYALYKQATVGDASCKRPGITQMVKRVQWDAWQELKGLPQDQAKQQYADYVDSLLASTTST
ncbi:MAG: acyl-CoA-binding protein [Pseudomonadales bacterium]|nr:acyl-CoA-binding protein [Pseudomonadales bacterium]